MFLVLHFTYYQFLLMVVVNEANLRGIDAPIRGKGYDPVMFTKDAHMLQWLHVNAVRPSHYPYYEEFYYMADRAGIVRCFTKMLVF